MISTKEYHAVAHRGPFIFISQLRMLRDLVAVMAPAWHRQGLTLVSHVWSSTRAARVLAALCLTPPDGHFLKELRYPSMLVHSLNSLQPPTHRSGSNASPPTSVELLQLYRSAESPVTLIKFKVKNWVRLT